MDERFPKPVKKLGLCPAATGSGTVGFGIWKVGSGCCKDSCCEVGAWSRVARGPGERGWQRQAPQNLKDEAHPAVGRIGGGRARHPDFVV